MRRTWSSVDGLKLALREALDNAKATKPRVGWVRGNSVASLEALEDLHLVRKENTTLKSALGRLETDFPLPELPSAEDFALLDLLPNIASDGYGAGMSTGSHAQIKCSWISMFPTFHINLQWGSNDWNGEFEYYISKEESCVAIGSALAKIFTSKETSARFRLDESDFDRLLSYYIEAGLVSQSGPEPFKERAEKIARRYRILGTHSSSFLKVSGEVDVSDISRSNRDLDDEIPF